MLVIRTAAALAAAAAVVFVPPAAAVGGFASFTDGADDAYRVPAAPMAPPASQPPVPELSDPNLDIVEASFRTVTARRNSHSYEVTMTLVGAPSGANNYVVAGNFGEDCTAYYFLEPNRRTFANLFCYDDAGESVYIGSIPGSNVVTTDRTLSAVFSTTRWAPAELKADPALRELFAYTCASTSADPLGCRAETKVDVARSDATFTV